MGCANGKPVLKDEDVKALSRTSKLSEEKVREQFEQFLQENPSGRITKKSFRDLISKAIPGTDAGKMEKHIFRIYDTNNDGHIDFVEFMVAYYVMSEGTPEENLSKIFRVFDVNSDGSISKKELKRLVKDMVGLINLDSAEPHTNNEIADGAFAEMDKDDDGKVTEAEFINACLAQEQFSKLLAMKIIDIFLENNSKWQK